MENENLIEKLAFKFGQNASVKSVYGEPIQVGNKTIIPVAQIAYGFGGGYGKQGEKIGDTPLGEESLNDISESDSEKTGGGGGGGLMAKPKGVYEVTSTSTRFIPANNFKQLLICFASGFLLSKFLSSKYSKYKK